MKKYYLAILLFSLASSETYSQQGKSFGIQLGTGIGGLSGFSGYTNGIALGGGIFKQWMKWNKKSFQPSFGIEMQINAHFNTMDNNNFGGGPSISVTEYTLPLLFKINLASHTVEIPVNETDGEGNKKTAWIFRGIYLFAGPMLGYLSTNASGAGTLSPTFGGAMAGIQVWVGNAKIEISGNRSLSKIYKENDRYVFYGLLSIGWAL